MANKLRYRSGDTDPRFLAIGSAVVIEIGDMLYRDPDDNTIHPASDMTDCGTEALNQDTFQQYFAGVAEQQSISGDTAKIRIATKGCFEFDIASGTWEAGAYIGIAEAASGTALEDQKVAAVSTPSSAIGRAHEKISTADTSILVDIVSTIFHGGIQATVAGSSGDI